ncbi:MAG: hypothetical protein KJZ92_16260 [Rhodocyclaceae bacterium]|nr:hypothetical protein [Opitutaceae bacterium]MCL4682804.1 hypothetical protein [Rhodocyclaceae bacterium]
MNLTVLSKGDAFTAPVFMGDGERRAWYGRAAWELTDGHVIDICQTAERAAQYAGQEDAHAGRDRAEGGNPFDPLFLGGLPNFIWDRGYRLGQWQGGRAREKGEEPAWIRSKERLSRLAA